MPSSVPADAAAVVVNVGAVDQTQAGYLTVWPAGQPMPPTSNLNFAPSQAGFGVDNLVTVALGSAGGTPAVSIEDGSSNGGTVDVTVDLQGYYAPPATGSNAGGFTPMSPTRIADSRCNSSSPPSFCSSSNPPAANSDVVTLGPGDTDTLTVAGVGGVPATGVEAAIMNVGITDATAASYLSIYPGPSQPVVSNINWTTGETISNKALVDLSAAGQVTIYNASGDVDVVVDVDGWFSSAASSSAASLFTPMSPVRLADTRCGETPAPSFCSSEELPSSNSGLTSLSGGQWASVDVGGVDAVPSSATGAVLNVTDVQPATGNYLTVYPGDESAPLAADVNYFPPDPSDIVPNAAYAALSPSGVADVANGPSTAGLTDVVVDLFGYFSPAASSSPLAAVTPSASTLPANGSGTSTITTTLTSLGVPLSGIPVSLSAVPSVSGACGTLSPASGLTDSAGQFVSTYTASTVSGACTITSSVDGLTPTTVLTQTASGAGSPVATVLASLGSLAANGSSASTITTTLTSLGVPQAGLPVSLSESPSPPGSCGSLVPTSGVTNSAGQLISTYTASAVPGTCTITSSVDSLLPSTEIVQTPAL